MIHLGGEFGSVMAVCAVSLALVAVFPYEALSFRAETPARRPVSAAFVTLSGRSEEEVVRAVKENWRKDSGTARLYADLVFSELPSSPGEPVLSVESRGTPPALPVVESGIGPYLPSARAPDPETLQPEAVRLPLAFPREELLKLR